MAKWEYLIAMTHDLPNAYSRVLEINGLSLAQGEQPKVFDFLADKGQEGWEMVDVEQLGSWRYYFFKRTRSK